MMTLNHGLSGYICGRVVRPALDRHAPVPPRALGWAFFLGAMLPDLDVLSRVVAGPARYFSGAWYGHRQASHSVLGTLVLALVAAAVLYGPLVARHLAAARAEPAVPLAPPGAAGTVVRYGWLVGALWAAGLIHIVGDLFTPGMPMPVLWPLEPRVGALRHIGWFSPYLLWLFVATIALDWSARGLAHGWPVVRRWLPTATWGLYLLAAYRWIDFLLVSRYASGAQWEAYQRTLLPEAMIGPLAEGVHFLWHWITR